jgi:glycosyltransferase involved in cell wall biosynthesis
MIRNSQTENEPSRAGRAPIRLLALLEADTVTGPARNVIGFCRRSRPGSEGIAGLPAVETVIATFHRGSLPPGSARTWQSMEASEAPNQFMAAVREAGIELEVVEEHFRYDPRVIGRLRRLVDKHQPEIIETHSVKSHFLVRLSGLWRRVPWIAFHHGYTWPDLRMRAYNHLDRWSLLAPAHLVAVSRAFAKELANKGIPSSRISVLHSAIQPDWCAEISDEVVRRLRSSLGVGEGESLILAVGRLSYEKAHADLIAAIAHLHEHEPQQKIRLVIVGEGPERHRLERTIAALHLGEYITLAGQIRDVRPYYAAADLFALPSLSEGSPNVLLEAMSASLPIVATAVGGVPEMVTHNESALLVPPREPLSLATAISETLRDNQRALARVTAARQVMINRYSPQARVRSLIETYCRLLDRPFERKTGLMTEVVSITAGAVK